VTSARDEVLARVRAALGDRPAPEPVVRSYDRGSGRAGSLALLAERIEDYRARVHVVAEADLPAALARALRGRRTVVPTGFPAAWLAEVEGELVPDGADVTAELLDGLDSVVSTCQVAIAETGTVVLDGQAGQGRRVVTLVPDHHVLVVRAEQVVEDVPQALARLDPVRPQTWISGPSATSDIELQRVEGVHGPRRLEVVLVTAAPEPVAARRGRAAGPG